VNGLDTVTLLAAFAVAVVLIFSVDRRADCSDCHGQGQSKDGTPCVICRGTGRVS
jgi:DnaJ-class molecular chaperone